ncbi:MAG: adenylyl-sulfate kinase [Rheinheimera sp.]|nr:adenylyl-sulfate kinase [Rheinheimera sp.]
MSNIVWQQHQIDRTTREAQKQQQAVVLWFTGLSGAGKSTVANALEQAFGWCGCAYLFAGWR